MLNPDYTEARKILEKYPYFAYAALKAIPSAPGKRERENLRRIVAVNIGDRESLREILGLNSESLADLYPDGIPPRLSTIDTIDTFLANFGEKTTAVPAPADYASMIGEEETQQDAEATPIPPDDSTASAIDAFLKAVPPPRPKRIEKLPPAEESPALTESFARILIKNHNYGKALEIIEELNLKNPEKSIYFADQIRFLRKLIINQSKQNN